MYVKTLGIIPARFGSTRFPGKPLALIQGKPMIQWVYANASKANLLSNLVVATDHQGIADCVSSFGGNVMMTRPDHLSGTDRCAEVLENLNENEQYQCVINIQGDEPLVNAEHINKLVELFKDETVKIASLMYPSIDNSAINNPNKVKVLVNTKEDYAIRFGRILKNVRLNSPFFLHIGLYGFTTETLLKIVKLKPTENEIKEKLEQLRWMDNGYKIKLAKVENTSIGVDVPEDIKKIEDMLKKHTI